MGVKVKMLNYFAFARLCGVAEQILREKAPIDTGNLRYNAIKGKLKAENVYELEVDQSIAPYMVFTNEPWISPKWNGKKNPNEKWFENATYYIALDLAKRLGGKLEVIK